MIMQASERRSASVLHCKAVREGAKSTRTLREKHRSRGDRLVRLGKAKVVDMLVWAHQCHLLGGNTLSGEFVFVSHPAFDGETGSGGAVNESFVRGCSCRCLGAVYCHLSPVFERSNSAWLLEIQILLGLWKLSLISKIA